MATRTASRSGYCPGGYDCNAPEPLWQRIARDVIYDWKEPLGGSHALELLSTIGPGRIIKIGRVGIKAARAANRGGESAAAAGRRAHANYGTALGDKYDTRATLPSGKKPDAVNWEKREVRELKPDNRAAVRRGQRQVERYRKELEEVTRQPWTSAVDVYRSGP